MRNIIWLFILFCSSSHAMDIPLNEVRLLFNKSATNEESCKKLMSVLNQYNETNNSTLAAYKACATMMMANHVFNPISKLSNFNQGKELLEKCVAADKENIEIRYLRFTIQSKSPAFLGYNNSISNDKEFLLNVIIPLKDLQLKQMIIYYLKSSEYLSSIEKQKIKS